MGRFSESSCERIASRHRCFPSLRPRGVLGRAGWRRPDGDGASSDAAFPRRGRDCELINETAQTRGSSPKLASPAKPLVVIRNAPPLARDLPPDPPSPEYPVRLTFRLPDTVLVSPSPRGK
jgi:hypothetical protein